VKNRMRVRQHDKEVFRRTPHARWSVRMWEPDNSPHEAYGCHHRCPVYNDEAKQYTESWSWFIEDTFETDDKPKCYGCGASVPDCIQTVVRLYMGE